jgi:hypothetical protein
MKQLEDDLVRFKARAAKEKLVEFQNGFSSVHFMKRNKINNLIESIPLKKAIISEMKYRDFTKEFTWGDVSQPAQHWYVILKRAGLFQKLEDIDQEGYKKHVFGVDIINNKNIMDSLPEGMQIALDSFMRYEYRK